jgi:hypothetical protein
MDAATESRRERMLSAGLAGLQAGMLGVCWMLLGLGISAVWVRRSFWIAENLMASAFYGAGAIHSGFAVRTLSGLSLYLLLYSLLGAIFALVVNDRLTPVRVLLVSLVFALSWYYLTFGLLWKTHLPFVALLHSARPTVVGHLIFGAVLGRFPSYLSKAPETEVAVAPETPARAPDTEVPGESAAVEPDTEVPVEPIAPAPDTEVPANPPAESEAPREIDKE